MITRAGEAKSRLSVDQRIKLEYLWGLHYAQGKIADILNVNKSTISRELRRSLIEDEDELGYSKYIAWEWKRVEPESEYKKKVIEELKKELN